MQVRDDPYISPRACPPSKSRIDTIILEHKFKGDICWLGLRNGAAFGCLGSKLSRNLKRLTAFACVSLDCTVASSNLDAVRSKWKTLGSPTELLVSFNVYGHDHSAQIAGDTLASMRLFLQVPLYDARSLAYDNPQYLKLLGVSDLNLDVPAPLNLAQACDIPAEVSRLEIDALLDHIPQPSILRNVFTNCHTITVLKRSASKRVNFTRSQI